MTDKEREWVKLLDKLPEEKRKKIIWMEGLCKMDGEERQNKISMDIWNEPDPFTKPNDENDNDKLDERASIIQLYEDYCKTTLDKKQEELESELDQMESSDDELEKSLSEMMEEYKKKIGTGMTDREREWLKLLDTLPEEKRKKIKWMEGLCKLDGLERQNNISMDIWGEPDPFTKPIELDDMNELNERVKLIQWYEDYCKTTLDEKQKELESELDQIESSDDELEKSLSEMMEEYKKMTETKQKKLQKKKN